MPYKCCVAFCPGTERHLHLFPKDAELFRQWCIGIGRSELLEKDVALVRRSYRVCDIHFSQDQKVEGAHTRSGLISGAMPSLHLPGALHTQSQETLLKPATRTFVVDIASSAGQMEKSASRAASSLPHISSTSDLEPCGSRSISPPLLLPEAVEKSPAMTPVAPTSPKRNTGKRKRQNLLLAVNLRKKAELTPKAAKLYEFASKYRKLSQRLQQENINNKERTRMALKNVETGEFYRNKLNAETFRFLQSQITQQSKSARGRRFTEEDKLLCLSLLKQSSKGYKLLRKIFTLPSRRTLMRVLSSVPFECGINNSAIIESLKESVQKLKPENRHCLLIFDEMSLQPSILYNKADESFVGFQNYGEDCEEECVPKIADHAMTFMLRGLRKSWKQPISYYFAHNGMSNPKIAEHLKIVISKLLSIGFIIGGTVCDQYNKAAINSLVKDTKTAASAAGRSHDSYSFVVNDKEILPMFDFPHLLKGIRNNMVNYDVKFQWRNGEETASWKYIEDTYHLDDNADEDFRMLNKLTEEHINKNKIKKMKVKMAAQVFSHRVQSTMRALLNYGTGVLPPEALGTANFVLFMDKLFDSVNGSAVNPHDEKPLRRAITDKTMHCKFWDEAINVLRTMSFIRDGKNFVPPTVVNWILSISNLRALWHKMKNSGFEFLLPRNCNQDPLENFFGCIRSHGVRNINPTCKSFQTSFKSLIINNFMAYHSPSANCEEDQSDGVLDSLRTFIHCEQPRCQGVPLTFASGKSAELKSIKDTIIINLFGYLAGFVAKNILKAVSGCNICLSELLCPPGVMTEEHILIENRAYTHKALIRPRTKFITLFGLCVQVCRQWLPKIAAQKQLATKLFLIISYNINADIFCKCSNHNLFTEFVKIFVNFYLYSYTNNINNILKFKTHVNRIDFSDPLKKHAFKLAKKHRARAKQIRRTKLLQS